MRTRNFLRLAAIPIIAVVVTGCPKPQSGPPTPEPLPTLPPIPTPPPSPTPPPTPYVPNKRIDVGKIFNGMQLRTSLQTDWGTTATRDRAEPASYGVDVQVHVKVPKPHQDLEELSRLNSQLPNVLPQLPVLLTSSRVSPFFDELYRLKVTSLQQSLMHLDNMLSRHNFYDCETVLEIENPATKRHAVLLQADMDTDNDGSDSDRMAEVDGSSVTFAPFTSYKWAKKTTQENSFIVPRTARLHQVEQDLSMPGISSTRQQQLKNTRAALKSEISDLQKYSYLLGGEDPYIVLPGSMFHRRFGAFAPSVGDYCVVIYENMLFPAIVGDVGPNDLVGEASLRICRQINVRADANNRPVNDLKATYLIFPGSADKPFDVPDLDKWHARCDALLKELGGYQGTLMAWEDLTKPKPPPATPAPATPAPGSPATPSPAATPVAHPGPGTPGAASPAPSASPSPAKPAASPAAQATPVASSPKPGSSGAATPKSASARSATPAPQPSPTPAPSVTPAPHAAVTPAPGATH